MKLFERSARRKKAVDDIPSIPELEMELKREKYVQRYSSVLRSTIYTLIIVAAVAILVATLWLPVLRIYGGSMTPTLQDGDIAASLKSSDLEQGDVIAFYSNNKILIKRVIATTGEWVNIEEDGTVLVNGEVLEEPYVSEFSLGDCDIKLPYQVPEGKLFVMGDHRSVSVDSRKSAVGCVAQEQVVGKIVFRFWPLTAFGPLK